MALVVTGAGTGIGMGMGSDMDYLPFHSGGRFAVKAAWNSA
ncbi:hypothetical protein SSAG_05876 [Streptomyces sp. Mg1]|nr:hypothetical protein SSAG_05876 [Streptomyces sp. Mg1]